MLIVLSHFSQTYTAAIIKFARFEWAVEKLTELGVAAIVPVAASAEPGINTTIDAASSTAAPTAAIPATVRRVLPASLAREPGFVERFEREVEAMTAFRSENVVEVYESGQADDGTYYYRRQLEPLHSQDRRAVRTNLDDRRHRQGP